MFHELETFPKGHIFVDNIANLYNKKSTKSGKKSQGYSEKVTIQIQIKLSN